MTKREVLEMQMKLLIELKQEEERKIILTKDFCCNNELRIVTFDYDDLIYNKIESIKIYAFLTQLSNDKIKELELQLNLVGDNETEIQ